METLQPLKVDRTKLMTQSAYARANKISKQRVHQLIKEDRIKTIKIEGAILVIID